MALQAVLIHEGDSIALPLAKCGPRRCSEQGSCVRSSKDQEPPRCLCHKGFFGEACEEVMLQPTDNNCYSRCSGGHACMACAAALHRWVGPGAGRPVRRQVLLSVYAAQLDRHSGWCHD
jgi:hypothetical protein